MTKSASEIALRSVVGIVPYVGPFLNELVSTFIPDEREKRIKDFESLIEQKLSALSEDYLNEISKRPVHLSLLEQGYKEAVEAVTQNRRVFISNLVSSGVRKEEINLELTSQLFRILRELTDSEVILLRYLSSADDNDDIEFKKMFSDIVERADISSVDDNPEAIMRNALRDNSILTLRRLNLIDSSLTSAGNRSNGNFMKPLGSGKIKYQSTNVTSLGMLFLEYLDMAPEKSS